MEKWQAQRIGFNALKKRVLLFFILISPLFSLTAGEWLLGDRGSSVFLPEGWNLFSQDEKDRISFINPEEDIIFQITVYPGDLYSSDSAMIDNHLEGLTILEEDRSQFLYRGRSCSLADLSLDSEGVLIRGWFLFVNRDDFDYYLTVITSPDNYEKALPLILSCLDGFSPDDQSRMEAGPVSTMFAYGSNENQIQILKYSEGSLDYEWNSGREEAGKLLIEREALILSAYGEPEIFDKAWKRYYQLIYRNSADDLKDLAAQIQEDLLAVEDSEKAKILLRWLQEFEYGSTERFSDLMTSTESLIARTGDCDSLALIYVILLNSMDIPAILMVSREFSHAMAAVAVPVEGANFPFIDKNYVVAEMTKDVALGQISAEMADINKWVIIPFNEYGQGILTLGE
jgi:hypothetical protein